MLFLIIPRVDEMCFLLHLILNSNVVIVHGILGGDAIDIEQAPYQVNYGDKCGGVLIGQQWALTSAHCGIEHYIRIGSKYQLKGPKIRIVKHLFHPKYKLQHEFDYDVQLLKLRRKLHLNDKVFAVDISVEHDGIVKVAGWGYAKEKGDFIDLLQQVQLQIIPKQVCQVYKYSEYNNSLTDRMFCAGGLFRDACQGDSGGAAISQSKVIGISSFGHGCGRGIPGVYVNISHDDVRGWIREKTGI